MLVWANKDFESVTSTSHSFGYLALLKRNLILASTIAITRRSSQWSSYGSTTVRSVATATNQFQNKLSCAQNTFKLDHQKPITSSDCQWKEKLLYVSHPDYTEKILQRFHMNGCHPVSFQKSLNISGQGGKFWKKTIKVLFKEGNLVRHALNAVVPTGRSLRSKFPDSARIRFQLIGLP